MALTGRSDGEEGTGLADRGGVAADEGWSQLTGDRLSGGGHAGGGRKAEGKKCVGKSGSQFWRSSMLSRI